MTPPDAADAGPADLMALCGAVPQTIEEWEDCYQQRRCEWKVNCNRYNLYASVDECVADLSLELVDGQIGAERRERIRAVRENRASVDIATFTECLIARSPTNCQTALRAPSCALRFTGTVPDHGLCYTDIECERPGALCVQDSCDDTCCAGRCTPQGKEGEGCENLTGCDPGLSCSLADVCVGGEVDSRCAFDSDCDPGNFCNDHTGRCEADLPDGAVCDNILACEGEATCVGVHVDPPVVSYCRKVTVEGAPCDHYCKGNLYCDLSDPVGGIGTCRPLPRLGDLCSSRIPCVGVDTVCVGNRCELRADRNEPCEAGACLPGLFCSVELDPNNPGTCLPLGKADQPCTANNQCESYLCSGDADDPGTCRPWRDGCIGTVGP